MHIDQDKDMTGHQELAETQLGVLWWRYDRYRGSLYATPFWDERLENIQPHYKNNTSPTCSLHVSFVTS